MSNLKLRIMRISNLWRGSLLFLLLIGFAVTSAYSQEKTVTGTVAAEGEGALPGVTIVLKGTAQGVVTNIDGNYTITVPGPDAVLVFSFIGLSEQEVTVGTQTTIDVTLESDVTSLNEVVVTGYASQRKQDLTGSVGVVKAEELVQMPQGNVTQQLQGRVAGVTITQDSRPGASAKVRIRGTGSFQNNSPLYVVDGVPTSNINNLSPNDIETLTVLKDAGAASIYGSRASNGVILITTKKGSEGMNVNYSMYMGTQLAGDGPENLLNSTEFADLQWLVYKNDGTQENHPVYGPSSGSPTMPSWAANTNWYDEVTDNAMIMNHDLSLSGGNKTSKYYASLGYFDQDGTVIKNWYKKFNARFNSEFTIKDIVTVGENLNITHASSNGVSANGSEGTAMSMGVYRNQPIIPVIWNHGTFEGLSHTFEDGDWGGTGIAPRLGNGSNYVASRTRDADDNWQGITLLGNVFANVKIIDGLNFKTSFGGSLYNSYSTNWGSSTYESSENRATSSYSESASYGNNWTWTNTLTYDKKFGDHSILAVGGYEAGKTSIGRGVSAQRAGYFSDAFSYRTVSNGATLQNGDSWFSTPRSFVSQFLRVDYNFNSKYYASATVRRDGSSVFGESTRYGIFPSFSAGWRISKESFFDGADWLTDLKIRGGYGTMGNQLAVSTANQFYLYGGSTSTSYYDIAGTTNSSQQGFRPTRVGNPDAQWETNVTTNIGFDMHLLDNKFEIVFDWYNKQNVDLLVNPELPGTAGAASQPYVNVAEVKNSGIDLQFVYRQKWNDFGFEANATFMTVDNEIIAISEGVDYFDSGGSRIGSFNRNMVGSSMGEFWGYNVLGLFQSDSEATAANQDGAEAGFLRYEDNNGVDADGELTGEPDGQITPADRTSIGSPHPDFTYGLNLAFDYKNFDMTLFFYGSQGNDIFNYNKWWVDFWPSFQGQKSTDALYNSWTPENTGATVPKVSNKSNFSTNTVSSSYYVEDGSYLRLKSLQIGYTFPKVKLGNIFSSARIYVQGVNLFTITNYSGLDPELASFNDTAPGVDEGNLPSTKQFLFGVNLGF